MQSYALFKIICSHHIINNLLDVMVGPNRIGFKFACLFWVFHIFNFLTPLWKRRSFSSSLALSQFTHCHEIDSLVGEENDSLCALSYHQNVIEGSPFCFFFWYTTGQCKFVFMTLHSLVYSSYSFVIHYNLNKLFITKILGNFLILDRGQWAPWLCPKILLSVAFFEW